MKQLWFFGFGLFLLAASAAFGQGEVATSGVISAQVVNGRTRGAMSFPAQRFMPPAVVGAPYSAEQVQEHVQTLNDGTHITQNQMHTKIYRDSQGRMRTERPLIMGLPNASSDSPTVVEISDPVAGVHYTLDTQNKIAHRVAVDPQTAPRGLGNVVARNGQVISRAGTAPLPPPAGVPQQSQIVLSQRAIPVPDVKLPDFAEEKLPPQMIEGVLAEGVRRTNTIPVGAQGNDRPIAVTSETWTSPDLKGVMVLSKNADPRSGESTVKLTNISRNEPDASLFQPPPDYQIVDETGQFTIHYTQQ